MVHGLIHSTFEGFLRRCYGELLEVITAELRRGLEACEAQQLPQQFEEKCPYADSLFFRHVRSTAQVVNSSEDEVLFQYGRYFLQNAAEQGYSRMLSCFSKSFAGFLANLNNLHLQLSLGIPTLQTPDFRVEKVTSTSLELHYRSVRPGLGAMVEGLVHALAEYFYHDLPISMTWLKGRANKTCDHEVWHVTFPEDTSYSSQVDRLKQATDNAAVAVDAATFYRLHPYHLVLDTDCRVIQTGSVLERIMPSMVQGSPASDHFDILAPFMCPHNPWTFKGIATNVELCFVLKARRRKLEMKGQFIRTRLQPTAHSRAHVSHAAHATKSCTNLHASQPTFSRGSGSGNPGSPGARSLSLTAPVTRARSSIEHPLPNSSSLSAQNSEQQNGGAQLKRAASHGHYPVASHPNQGGRHCPVAGHHTRESPTDSTPPGQGLEKSASERQQSPSGHTQRQHTLPSSTSNASSRSREEGRKEERSSPEQSTSRRGTSSKPKGFLKKLGLGSGKGNPIKRAYQSMKSKPPAAASASPAHNDTAHGTSDESNNPPFLLGGATSNGNTAMSAPLQPNTVPHGASVRSNSHHTCEHTPLSNPVPSSNSSSVCAHDRSLPEVPLPCASRVSADVGQEVLLFVGTPRMLNLDEMQAYDMTLEDIPLHDITSDVLVMSERIEMDTRLRKKLQEERAVLEERAERLAAQNAAQEEAYLRMGEALEEALVQRDEHQGAPAYQGFHVETPAEKALELLDKILHGLHPGMREVLDVRDSILMAGTDLRVPLRLGDKMVQELGKSTPVDTEVAAALTQLLAAGGQGESRWSESESSDTASSEPEETLSGHNDARPSSAGNEGFSAFNRAFSSTLESFKRPFTGGQEGRRSSIREKHEKEKKRSSGRKSRRLTESLMAPLVGLERTSKMQPSRSASRTLSDQARDTSKMQPSRSASRTLSDQAKDTSKTQPSRSASRTLSDQARGTLSARGVKDAGGQSRRPPLRLSSSFTAGENIARVGRESILQQLQECVQQRSSAGPSFIAPTSSSNNRSGNNNAANSSMLVERIHELLSPRPSSRASGTSTSTSLTQAHTGQIPTGASIVCSSRASDRPLTPHCSSASATHLATHTTLECPGSPASHPSSSTHIGTTQGEHAGVSRPSLFDPALLSGSSAPFSAFCISGRSPPSTATWPTVVPPSSVNAPGPSPSSRQWVQSLSCKNSAAQLNIPATTTDRATPPTPDIAPSRRSIGAAHASPPGVRLGALGGSANLNGYGATPLRSLRDPGSMASSFSAGQAPESTLMQDLQKLPHRSFTGPLVPSSEQPTVAGGGIARHRSACSASTGENVQGRGVAVRRPPVRRKSSLLKNYRALGTKQPIQEELGTSDAAEQGSSPTSKKSEPLNREGPEPTLQAVSPPPAQGLLRKLSDGLSGLTGISDFGRVGKGAFVQALGGARPSSKTNVAQPPSAAEDDPERRADFERRSEEAIESSRLQVSGRNSSRLQDDVQGKLPPPTPQHPAHHANTQRCPEKEKFLQHQTSGASAHDDGSSSAPLPLPLSTPKRTAHNSRGTRRSMQAQLPSTPAILTVQPCETVEQLMKPPSDPLQCVLAKVDDWTFDAFELDAASDGRPLSSLAFALFTRGSLISHFKINSVRLARFLLTVEDRYNDNPYHNRIHAADVLRTLHVMMLRGGIRQAVHSTHDFVLLAAYMAAVVHDLEHKGVNNDFLVKTLDPLALFYNDRSPMENHHASAAFRLLLWEEQCAAFANSHTKVRDALRKIVVDTVLATDMKQHFNITSHFNTKIPTLLGHVKSETPPHSLESTHRSIQRPRMGEQANNAATTNNNSHANSNNNNISCTLPLPPSSSNNNNSSTVPPQAAATRPDSLELVRPVGPISDMSGTPHQLPHMQFLGGHNSSNPGSGHPARPASRESSARESNSVQGSSGDTLAVPASQQGPVSGLSGPPPPGSSSGLPATLRSSAASMGPSTGNRLPPPTPPQQPTPRNKSPPETVLSSCSNSLHSAAHELNIVDEDLRTLVLQMALKCADLGHLTHTRDVHRRWVLLLEEEMFRQGDAEKARGLPPSPLMDRTKSGISKSQAGFFSIVVLPQLESFCKVFPGCKPMLEQAQDNHHMWLEESKNSQNRKSLARE